MRPKAFAFGRIPVGLVSALTIYKRQSCRPCLLLVFRNKQTVIVVIAAINHVDFAGFGITEHKETVPQHIHFQNSFLNVHLIYMKTFGANNAVIFGLNIFINRGLKAAALKFAFKLCFVAYNLLCKRINNGFKGICSVGGGFFSF